MTFLPSPGSTISTVAASGYSSTAMTGSDSWISKVSEVSNSWSVKIFTLQVAVVWPGLNWTCFWALPRKSLSFSAEPSFVPIPKRERNPLNCEVRNSDSFIKKKKNPIQTEAEKTGRCFFSDHHILAGFAHIFPPLGCFLSFSYPLKWF